jgi:putative aldouronate transport system permease protein
LRISTVVSAILRKVYLILGVSMKKNYKQRNFSSYDITIVFFLLVFAVLVLFPFYNCLVLSFNTGSDAMKGNLYFWPRQFTLENYRKVLSEPIFKTAAINSILRTVITTVLAIIFTSVYAFVVSHKQVVFRNFYMLLGLITMYFSGGLIPTYLLVRDLNLLDKFMVYVYPNMFNMFNAILFISFFTGLPAALEESAKIDGANEFTILFRIIMPISTPVIAAVGLFVAVGQWNSWFDTMLYTKSESLETLSHMFQKMISTMQYLEQQLTQVSGESVEQLLKNNEVSTVTLQMAAMAITSFPVIVLYPFLQKYFIKGIMVGSIKG